MTFPDVLASCERSYDAKLVMVPNEAWRRMRAAAECADGDALLAAFASTFGIAPAKAFAPRARR